MNIDTGTLNERVLYILQNSLGPYTKTAHSIINAVLAEVAKHNTPDKPAYYDPKWKPPTKADAPSGYIITYDLTVDRWVDATWEYVAGHPQHYLAWYRQPDKPTTKDDEARESLLNLIREEGIGLPLGSDATLRRVWDAALAHRDKSKP